MYNLSISTAALKNKTPWLIIFTLLLFCKMPQGLAQGFMPSPAQIEAFKNLSPDEQKSMAEAAGIDVSSVINEMTPGKEQPQIVEQPINPEPAASKPAAENLHLSAVGTSEKLKLFGHDLFHASQDTFKPATDIPVPNNYILGPGDTLVIQLYGKENRVHSLVINREGQIQFPQMGPITLAGLTFEQAQSLIEEFISKQMIGVKSSITTGALRSIRVFVLGEVLSPGSFTVSSLSTMTNALFASGGISHVGSLRNIQLKRNGEIVAQLDLYDLLLQGDTSKDQRLMPGDVIFVPPMSRTVGIAGEIKRPAIYEFKNEKNVQDLLNLAGGLTNNAYLNTSSLTRNDGQGENVMVDIDISSESGRQFTLHDGDTLNIASKLDFVNDKIKLTGHIKREGNRPWSPGLKFTDLVPNQHSLLPNADTQIALIQRYFPSTQHTQVLLFSPQAAWLKPQSSQNPGLQEYDQIYFFDYESPRDAVLSDAIERMGIQAKFDERKRIVIINGSVRFPGGYPMSEGMTTQDLILLAGGLTESAQDTNGEITRYSIDEARQRVVHHINVNLSDRPTLLEPGDSLQVKQIPLWKQKETVQILGEVMFPGTYTILPGETILQVLTRAGGLTPHAFPLGAIFSRKDLRDLEAQRITEMRDKLQTEMVVAKKSSEATLTEAENERLLKNLSLVKPVGRMVIDLSSIIASPQHHDFQMEDGDTLSIPRYKPSVTVVGEVQYPTSHLYDAKLDAKTYIKRSGGLKKNADNKRIYIVKANGSVMEPQSSGWFRARNEKIEPGDTIIIPIETDKVDSLHVWAQVTQIIYQAALGAAAIKSF